MRLPSLRFTVRRLMVAVTAVAVLVSGVSTIERRRRLFHQEDRRHMRWLRAYYARTSEAAISSGSTSGPDERWHVQMASKYAAAARHPWLPVPPDPPEPK